MTKRDYSETIAAMRKLGWSYRKIAQALKISHEQVRQISQKASGPPRKPRKNGSAPLSGVLTDLDGAIIDCQQRLWTWQVKHG